MTVCALDLARGEARWADGHVERLSRAEIRLLRVLVDAGRTVSRDELLAGVTWHGVAPDDRSVDATVRRIRQKIERDARHPDHVLTTYGVGYRFVAAEAGEQAEAEPFVGRADEVRRLVAVAPGAPILVRGAPGIGKTRLVRHVAWRLGGLLSGGSLVVDLTEASDLPQVVVALTATLGLESPGRVDVAILRAAAAVRDRGPCLVVLDNCEGAGPAVVDALAAWTEGAPEARFVATSRDLLPFAEVIELDPLGVADGAALFEAFARRVRPDLPVDAEARSVVEQLVERLEGIPLAIALAAGRANALSPRAILDRLDDRFRLLASRARDGSDRHRTLRAALDSSWESLSPGERAALTACSVFRGGFDAAAAGAVFGRPDERDAEALLTSLRSRSLLTARGDRFGGYAFVLAYAGERLAEDPSADRVARRRHAEHFAAAARRPGVWQRALVLSADLANLEAAAERAIDDGWAELAGALALGAVAVMARTGPIERSLALARRCLRVDGLPEHDRIELMFRVAMFERWTGAADPGPTLDEVERLARRTGQPERIAYALWSRASWATGSSLAEALPLLVEAVALARIAPVVPDTLGMVLSSLAKRYRELGRFDEALATWDEALGVFPASEDGRLHAGRARVEMAAIYRSVGRYADAVAMNERGLAELLDSGYELNIAGALSGMGVVELTTGAWASARGWFLRALAVASRFGNFEVEGHMQMHVAVCDAALDDPTAARERLEVAIAAFDRVGDGRSAWIARGNLAEVELADGDPVAALAALTEAVAALRGAGDLPSATEFTASLAVGALRLGRGDEARRWVDQAESDARALRSPQLLALILARRGLVELAEGSDARATLAEAAQAAAGTGDASALGRAVAALRSAIQRPEGSPSIQRPEGSPSIQRPEGSPWIASAPQAPQRQYADSEGVAPPNKIGDVQS